MHYPYTKQGLYDALITTGAAWAEIAQKGCSKKDIEYLQNHISKCPCCTFAYTTKDYIETTIIKNLNRCDFCPMAGEWEINSTLLIRNLPCTAGLFGEWNMLLPSSSKARSIAATIASKAFKIAALVLNASEE